jgi:hypothetical protein
MTFHGRTLALGLALWCAAVAVNRGEAMVRGRLAAAANPAALQVNVRAEGTLVGHSTIGVDETSLRDSRFLHFATLGQWEFTRARQTPPPPKIQALSGRRFSSVGFMYPLESGEMLSSFCLLRSTQTCCYGPNPDYNQYLFVETPAPVPMERLAPVLVTGTFVVDPNVDEGYIYRMEGATVAKIGEDLPDVDPAGFAREAGLPLFDFAPLAGMAGRADPPVPEALTALDGQEVAVGGYCVDRAEGEAGAPPRLMVAKEWWDGVSQGQPPSIFNSVVVAPRVGHVPPLWKPRQVFRGTLRVHADPAVWPEQGVVQLEDAELVRPAPPPGAAPSRTPALAPWPVEAGALALVLLLAVRRRRRAE